MGTGYVSNVQWNVHFDTIYSQLVYTVKHVKVVLVVVLALISHCGLVFLYLILRN